MRKKKDYSLALVDEYIKATYPGSYTWSARDPTHDVSALYAVINGKVFVFFSPVNKPTADAQVDAINFAGGYAVTVSSLLDAQAVIDAAGLSMHEGPVTLREFSQLYYLKKEIADSERRLAEIKSQAGPKASSTDGVVVSGGELEHGQPEELAIEIIALEFMIAKNKQRASLELARLTDFISSVDDSFMRLILTHRFIDCYKWDQVAAAIGGNNTAASVSQNCYRFIKRLARDGGKR